MIAQGLQRTADNGRSEGGRLFMVIICPIGWGMAQRGESKHKERFVQRQRNARPNKRAGFTLSTGCSPSGSSSCDIPGRPRSTQRPDHRLVRTVQMQENQAHLYIFYPLEALVEGEVVPNCVLKLLLRLEFVSRTLQNQLPICLFSPFSAPARFQTQLSGRL